QTNPAPPAHPPLPIQALHPVPAMTAPAIPAGVDSFLKWDSEVQEVTVTNGTLQAHFTFLLTNVASEPITINDVHASCGCTSARLPEQPWKLMPGTNGEIHVTMNLLGKVGLVPKTVTINTDKGSKVLFVKSNILPPPAPTQMITGDREANQKAALADRQAVFHGDCAKCHTESKDKAGNDKFGRDLYASVCSVCHEAEHRAAMVPSLRAIPQQTNAEFWRNWVSQGKPGTLMPAFSVKQGGILTDTQIESLVNFLVEAFPSRPQAPAARQVLQVR
ncbi:MAG TPA: DUF1573 domain-containing protein, partial [Candidatus Paceibacterota bacterium]|nr:DUF1573 domain-containing protein [Candidatus Paceibacterota bacterium]